MVQMEPPPPGDRQQLYGYDELRSRGWHVTSNMAGKWVPGRWFYQLGRLLDAATWKLGGRGGDYGSVLAALRYRSDYDLLFSSVDSAGLPLIALNRWLKFNVPIVYASIGLLERMDTLSPRGRAWYRRALSNTDCVIAYGWEESERLRAWLSESPNGPPVHFVPYGVDPRLNELELGDVKAPVDVVSVGGDPQRDFPLLLDIARRHPNWSFSVVASDLHRSTLADPPVNVTVRFNTTLRDTLSLIAQARVVALPVLENTYSGATTTLLQAMSLAKPVVVSRTGAIRQGYGLMHGVNALLPEPSDMAAFESSIQALLGDSDLCIRLGRQASDHVRSSLSWTTFGDTLDRIFRDVLASPRKTHAASFSRQSNSKGAT